MIPNVIIKLNADRTNLLWLLNHNSYACNSINDDVLLFKCIGIYDIDNKLKCSYI